MHSFLPLAFLPILLIEISRRGGKTAHTDLCCCRLASFSTGSPAAHRFAAVAVAVVIVTVNAPAVVGRCSPCERKVRDVSTIPFVHVVMYGKKGSHEDRKCLSCLTISSSPATVTFPLAASSSSLIPSWRNDDARVKKLLTCRPLERIFPLALVQLPSGRF